MHGGKMDIYVISSGRHTKQTTIENLPPALAAKVTLVVPPAEWRKYNSINLNVKEVVAPKIPMGVGYARQWCIDSTLRKCLMLDDDLVFATRREDEPSKFRESSYEEIIKLVEDIEFCLENYAHVGVATREGGNRLKDAYDYNTRLLRALAYRTDVLKKERIKFCDMTVMEDFNVALALLIRGYENIKINYMVQNQNGSGLEGGCSQYRTMGIQAEAAHELHARYPDFVKVVKKKTKEAWGGGERTDVTIQWKKALNSAPEVKDVRAA